jgi:uncharacterized RDD family membrane protein YckC
MVERVTIETPERVAFSVELADLGSRFLAIAVDVAIQGAALLVVVAILAGAWGLSDASSPSPRFQQIRVTLLSIGMVALFLIFWGYHVAFETWGRGQTPGKRVFGLRVVKDDGSAVGFLDAVVRNLVRVVDILPSSYAIGVVAIFLSKRHKRLGDMAAGTLVVHEPAARTWVAPAVGDPRVALLLADFLERADELAPEARDRISMALAARLGLETVADPAQALAGLRRLRVGARAIG